MRVGMFLNYAGGFRETADEVAELEAAAGEPRSRQRDGGCSSGGGSLACARGGAKLFPPPPLYVCGLRAIV
jgi:hypothetical protein